MMVLQSIVGQVAAYRTGSGTIRWWQTLRYTRFERGDQSDGADRRVQLALGSRFWP